MRAVEEAGRPASPDHGSRSCGNRRLRNVHRRDIHDARPPPRPKRRVPTRSSLMSCQLSVCHAFHTYRRASRHGLPRFSSFLSSSSYYYYYSCYYSYSSLFLSFRFQLFFANFSLCSLTPSSLLVLLSSLLACSLASAAISSFSLVLVGLIRRVRTVVLQIRGCGAFRCSRGIYYW